MRSVFRLGQVTSVPNLNVGILLVSSQQAKSSVLQLLQIKWQKMENVSSKNKLTYSIASMIGKTYDPRVAWCNLILVSDCSFINDLAKFDIVTSSPPVPSHIYNIDDQGLR